MKYNTFRSFAVVMALFWRLDLSVCGRYNNNNNNDRQLLFGIRSHPYHPFLLFTTVRGGGGDDEDNNPLRGGESANLSLSKAPEVFNKTKTTTTDQQEENTETTTNVSSSTREKLFNEKQRVMEEDELKLLDHQDNNETANVSRLRQEMNKKKEEEELILLDQEKNGTETNATNTTTTTPPTVPTFHTWSDMVEQPLFPHPALLEDDQQENVNTTNTTSTVNASTAQLRFSMLKEGDGSQEDPDGIPTRYLIAHKQNREKALAAFQHTCEWRKEHAIDTILLEPQTNFDICRQIFPIFLPGRDTEGHLIIVQRPGMVDLHKANEFNITHDEILMHYLYLVEYAWNLLDPSPLPPQGLMTTILDCQGVRFGMFQDKEFRTFGSRLVKIMSDHYPTRSYKTLIVHAPKWIKMAFNLVKPLMRESTRKKIIILNTGPEQDRYLKELLGGDNVPAYLLSDNNNNNHNHNKKVDDDKRKKNKKNSSLKKEETVEDYSEIEHELRLVASVGLGNIHKLETNKVEESTTTTTSTTSVVEKETTSSVSQGQEESSTTTTTTSTLSS
eukprot:scaffold16490_cov113-Cylindrotheca_fusiformis.AAC.8